MRQSDFWSKYLGFSGWETIKTKSGVKVRFLKLLGRKLVKIQKCPPLNKTQLQEIEDLCVKNKALFIKIEPGVGQDEKLLLEQEYKESDFPLSPTISLVIDLQKPEKELWEDLSKSAKYSVRRAQREGAKVEHFVNPDNAMLEGIFPLLQETGKRKKFYIQSFKDLVTKRSIFGDKSYLIKVLDKSGDTLGVQICLGMEETVTFTHGGSVGRGRKTKAGYELMWQSILYFKKLGYKWFDLEGVDDDRFPRFTRDWGGFSHFKEKFGGFRVEFPPPYIKYLSPVLKFLSKFNELPL
ncbi:lipid II:glycine glycyltransferase FemX [Patescibacteria group bacterium]